MIIRYTPVHAMTTVETMMRTSRVVIGVIDLLYEKREKIKDKRGGFLKNVYFNIENSSDTHTMSPFMNSPALDSLLQKLPYLKHLVDTCGDMSLLDYAHSHYRVVAHEDLFFLERKKEFLNIIENFVS